MRKSDGGEGDWRTSNLALPNADRFVGFGASVVVVVVVAGVVVGINLVTVDLNGCWMFYEIDKFL